MSRLAFLTVFIMAKSLAFSQEKRSGISLAKTLYSDSSSVMTIRDSITNQFYGFQADSIFARTRVRDSVVILSWGDSLRAKVNSAYSPEAIRRFGDSLQQLRLPQPVITRRTDSLRRRLMRSLNASWRAFP